MAATYDPMVEKAQNRLTELGYKPGPIDGKMGKKTEEAIKNFQRDNDLSITGKLDEKTMQKLGLTFQIKESEEITQLLEEHHSRLLKENVDASFFMTMKPLWDKLMRPDIISFSVEAAVEEIQKSFQDGRHHYRSKKFEDIYVAVSTLPTIENSMCRELFGKNYTAFLDDLMAESGYADGDCDLVHWIYCDDGKTQRKIFLTFFPSWDLVQTQGPQTLVVIPPELLSPSEKRKMGID